MTSKLELALRQQIKDLKLAVQYQAETIRLLAERNPPQTLLPYLVWEDPDEEGDVVVSLQGLPHWHLTGHGKTQEEALKALGEVLALI